MTRIPYPSISCSESYVLYPKIKLKADTEGGLKVEPLNDTVEFCKRNTYAFEPALELLDEEYNLDLKVRYSR